MRYMTANSGTQPCLTIDVPLTRFPPFSCTGANNEKPTTYEALLDGLMWAQTNPSTS
ncbi:hypothetical protein ACSS6W_002510 [Trichoderma asperelloides]